MKSRVIAILLGMSLPICALGGVAVNLQVPPPPGTQQNGFFNVSGAGISQVQDLGGQVYNVKNVYPAGGASCLQGAKGDGTTDDTLAIGCAITAAGGATARGVVFFPPGTYNTTGHYNLTSLNGLVIQGSGVASTTLKITSAVNNLFYWDNGAAVEQTFRDFLVTSAVNFRTGGWVFSYVPPVPSLGYLTQARFENIDIRNQWNGIQIGQFLFVHMSHIMMSEWSQPAPPAFQSGIGLQIGQWAGAVINQGTGFHITNVHIYGNNLITNAVLPIGTGVLVQDCDAIAAYDLEVGGGYFDCMKMEAGIYGLHNHFFSMSQFDSSTAATVWIHNAGTGSVGDIRFVGCYFANGGHFSGYPDNPGQPVVLVEPSMQGSTFSGCTFASSTGTLFVIRKNMWGGTITGNTLTADACQNAILYSDEYANAVGPTISGNSVISGNIPGTCTAYAIVTDNTAYRSVIVGNTLIGGTSFGTPPPAVVANNGL
jgi:hypothetical protein